QEVIHVDHELEALESGACFRRARVGHDHVVTKVDQRADWVRAAIEHRSVEIVGSAVLSRSAAAERSLTPSKPEAEYLGREKPLRIDGFEPGAWGDDIPTRCIPVSEKSVEQRDRSRRVAAVRMLGDAGAV